MKEKIEKLLSQNIHLRDSSLSAWIRDNKRESRESFLKYSEVVKVLENLLTEPVLKFNTIITKG